MNNNSKKSLEEVELERQSLSKEYNSILNEKESLEKSPIVIAYKRLLENLKLVGDNYNEVNEEYFKLYQSNCTHPLWYFISDETDDYEGRQQWACKCVRCGMVKEGHSREFPNLIIGSMSMGFGKQCPTSYRDIRAEYLNLEEKQNNDQQNVKMMIKKYNNLKR